MSQQIAQNLKTVKEKIEKTNQNIKLVAVTKTRSPKEVSFAIEAGIISIGENKVQEAEQKFLETPLVGGIEKRLIGRLQSNKIKRAIRIFDTIDSVDSIRLAHKISQAATVIKKIQRVLIQVNTTNEETKGGFSLESESEIIECFNFSGIKIEGLMTIGPTEKDKEKKQEAFKRLRRIFIKINKEVGPEKQMKDLSMGMSGDFLMGISEGATIVRVGSLIFGERKAHA
jgi:pyridoxal phosphate enzyme (YggS family)|tara:strand:+ start:205 stop:888 length:684 start_codon:yes stop_codon:yes gene_type:complete